MLNAQVLEIFRSIQGEGKSVGLPQVFVRLFKCNMHCVWCDTPHSIGDTSNRYFEYSLEDLLNEINQHWDQACDSVSITGGEPLLQADFLKELCPRLKEEGKSIHLDTNGTLPDELKKIIDYVDVIAMDIKMPSSTQQQSYWQEHLEFLKIALAKDVFIKLVISSDTSDEDLEQTVNLISDVDASIDVYLQPNFFDMKNGVVQKCVDWQTANRSRLNNLRILPQTHKMLKVR